MMTLRRIKRSLRRTDGEDDDFEEDDEDDENNYKLDNHCPSRTEKKMFHRQICKQHDATFHNDARRGMGEAVAKIYYTYTQMINRETTSQHSTIKTKEKQKRSSSPDQQQQQLQQRKEKESCGESSQMIFIN